MGFAIVLTMEKTVVWGLRQFAFSQSNLAIAQPLIAIDRNVQKLIFRMGLQKNG